MDIKEWAQVGTTFLGDELRKAIKQAGWTLAQVGKELGSNHSQMSRYVNGKRALPSTTFLAICALIDASPSQLIENAHARLIEQHGTWASNTTTTTTKPEPTPKTTPEPRERPFYEWELAAFESPYDPQLEDIDQMPAYEDFDQTSGVGDDHVA